MSQKTLKKITYGSNDIQVESAIRDGLGNRIDTTYAKIEDLGDLSIDVSEGLSYSEGIISIDPEYKLPTLTEWNAIPSSLGTAAVKDVGTSAGNVPVLDSNGKLSTSIIPAIAINDTFVVNSQASMLALTAQIGDVCVRTDLNKSFILKTDGASTLSNWQELLTPTDLVQSVNGKVGVVVLTASDVGAAASSHTHSINDITGAGTQVTYSLSGTTLTITTK